MESTSKYKVKDIKVINDTYHVKISKGWSSETIVLNEDATPTQLKYLILAAISTLKKGNPETQINTVMVLSNLNFIYLGNEEKKHHILTSISESNIHNFIEEKMMEVFDTQVNSLSRMQKNFISSVYLLCHNLTDESQTFAKKVWSTDILRILKHNLCNPNLIENKDDEYCFNLTLSSIGILHNVLRHVDSSLREIMSTSDIKLSLTKFVDWPYTVSLSAFFILSMLIDSSELSLLDNQMNTLNELVNLSMSAWESNLRRHDGYHLDELLTGMYYAIKSDKLKMAILNKRMIGFLFEILQLMERQSETEEVLMILKQLSRCEAAKQKLVEEFDIISVLKDSLEKSGSHVKLMIQDLIRIYSA